MGFQLNSLSGVILKIKINIHRKTYSCALFIFLLCFLRSNFWVLWPLLTHNLTQNRKKTVGTTGQRGLESIWLRRQESPKVPERPKPHFGAQLITRRLQVQVLSPQPEILWFRLKSEDFPFFSSLFSVVNFCFQFLTHFLTHTGKCPERAREHRRGRWS